MRLKLTCEISNNNPFIKKDYHHKLSSLIYDLIGEYDSTLSTEIHNSKKFKRFSISRLNFGRYIIDDDKYNILDKNINFIVSTSDSKISESLLNLNKKNIRSLGDGLFFKIQKIELENRNFKNDEIFELKTPIVISISSREYIFPCHKDFKDMFFKNLIRKCGDNIEDYDYHNFKLDIIGDYKKKKNGHNNNCSIFNFKLECPEKLIKIGLVEGFGIHNAQGNGFVK